MHKESNFFLYLLCVIMRDEFKTNHTMIFLRFKVKIDLSLHTSQLYQMYTVANFVIKWRNRATPRIEFTSMRNLIFIFCNFCVFNSRFSEWRKKNIIQQKKSYNSTFLNITGRKRLIELFLSSVAFYAFSTNSKQALNFSKVKKREGETEIWKG